MGVEYRLSRCVPAIHPDVETLRVELLLKYVLDLSDQSKRIRVFLGCHFP
jgi:hypothetical protein